MGERSLEERVMALEYQRLTDAKDMHDLKTDINNVRNDQESFHIQIKAMFDSIMAQIAEIKKWQFEKDAVAAYKEKCDAELNDGKKLWFPLLTEWVKILSPAVIIIVALLVTGGVSA